MSVFLSAQVEICGVVTPNSTGHVRLGGLGEERGDTQRERERERERKGREK